MSINYIHQTHPRSRSLKIKVEDTGQVVVVTPKWISDQKVKQYIKENEAWIQRALAKQSKKIQTETDTDILIFGKKYTKKIYQSQPLANTNLPMGISIQKNICIINHIPGSPITQEKTKKTVERFLKNTAEKYIVPRTHQLAKAMNTSINKITLRQQKTRWGSCSSAGNLNFNWRLVHYPPEVIDYVIIHELAHRTHMDHSSSFWQLVARYDPDHLKHRNWLKKHGVSVG